MKWQVRGDDAERAGKQDAERLPVLLDAEDAVQQQDRLARSRFHVEERAVGQLDGFLGEGREATHAAVLSGRCGASALSRGGGKASETAKLRAMRALAITIGIHGEVAVR